MNTNKFHVSAENTPGQAAFSPARHIGHQTSDVHYYSRDTEEVKVQPRQFVSSSVTIFDDLGTTLNEY